ncbi:MAG: polysaccharide deacetylase family protein [Patescibacteria group bacterium]
MKKIILLIISLFFFISLPVLAKPRPEDLHQCNFSDTIAVQSEPSTTSVPTVDLNQNFINQDLNIPILMFHYIEDVPADTHDQMRYKLSYSPQKLEQLLQYLSEQNIQTLTFWDIKDILAGQKAAPDRAIVLTFDDGYLDQYQNAFPLLEKYHQHGVFYIITNQPDQDSNYMTWPQIKTLQLAGHEIGSHTVSHPNLTSLSLTQVDQEMQQSKQIIEEKIDYPIISFCYPIGKYNDDIINIAKQYYLFGRTTSAGTELHTDRRFQLPIIRIFPTTSVDSIRYLFS